MTDRSADELERDAETIRSGIARTTDELKTRMSPGQMVDEVTRYLRDSDGAIAVDRLRHQVRENPMALALVGAGLAWLMIGNGEQSSSRDRDRAYGDAPRLPQSYGTGSTAYPAAGTGGASSPAYPAARSSGVGTGGASASGSASSTAASSGPSMGERASGLAEQAGSFVHDASERARAFGHDASDRARALGHDAAERGRRVGEASRDYADYGRRSLLDALDREPLITGAIGLAVGAAIGSMLPATRLENETFGETRDDLLRSAGDALTDAGHRAEQVAGEAYDAARDAAEREGLVPEDGDRTVAERVGSVAKAAASAATGSSAASGGTGSGQSTGVTDTGSTGGTGTSGTGTSGTAAGTGFTPGAGSGAAGIEPKHSLGAERRVGETVTPGSDDRASQGSDPSRTGRV